MRPIAVVARVVATKPPYDMICAFETTPGKVRSRCCRAMLSALHDLRVDAGLKVVREVAVQRALVAALHRWRTASEIEEVSRPDAEEIGFALQMAEPHVGVVAAAADVRQERLEVETLVALRRRERRRPELHAGNRVGGGQLHAATDARALLEAADDRARIGRPELIAVSVSRTAPGGTSTRGNGHRGYLSPRFAADSRRHR